MSCTFSEHQFSHLSNRGNDTPHIPLREDPHEMKLLVQGLKQGRFAINIPFPFQMGISERRLQKSLHSFAI